MLSLNPALSEPWAVVGAYELMHVWGAAFPVRRRRGHRSSDSIALVYSRTALSEKKPTVKPKSPEKSKPDEKDPEKSPTKKQEGEWATWAWLRIWGHFRSRLAAHLGTSLSAFAWLGGRPGPQFRQEKHCQRHWSNLPGQCRSVPQDVVFDDHELMEVKIAAQKILYIQCVTESKDLDICLEIVFQKAPIWGIKTWAS